MWHAELRKEADKTCIGGCATACSRLANKRQPDMQAGRTAQAEAMRRDRIGAPAGWLACLRLDDSHLGIDCVVDVLGGEAGGRAALPGPQLPLPLLQCLAEQREVCVCGSVGSGDQTSRTRGDNSCPDTAQLGWKEQST